MLDERILHSPVFLHFEREEVEHFLDCTGARPVHLERGNQLSLSGRQNSEVGILLSGSLSMACCDAFGNRFLLSNLAEGEIFGLPVALASEDRAFYLLACSGCDLVLMNSFKFLNGCDSCCIPHRRLYENLICVLAEQNRQLLRKQYHMAQRTLRRKLASFLSEQSGLAGSKRFSVRMDRQELADYLGVDRSALCAELSRMKKEGLLDYHRHDFCLLDTLLEESFDI